MGIRRPPRSMVLGPHGVFVVILMIFVLAQTGVIPRPGPRKRAPRAALDEVIATAAEETGTAAEALVAGPVWLGLGGSGPATGDPWPRPDGAEPANTAGDADAGVLEILRVFARVRHDLIDCYRRGLRWRPDLAGKLVLHFVIAADGRVTRARIEKDALDDPIVSHCILTRLRAIRFPPPHHRADAEFTIPFVFLPPGGP